MRRQKGPEPEHGRERGRQELRGALYVKSFGQITAVPTRAVVRPARRVGGEKSIAPFGPKIDVRPGGVEGRGNATPRAAVHETRPASVRPGEQARPNLRPTRYTRLDRPTKPTRMSSLTRIYTPRDQSTRNSWRRRSVRPFRNISPASFSFQFPGVLEND